MEILKTDVLVVGGGGAGLRAALAAREEGAEVVLASKTPVGKSTCTYLSGGAFSLAAEGFSEQAHVEATLRVGRGLNQRDMVRTMAAEAPPRLRELETYGLEGEWRWGRFMTRGKPPSWGAPLALALTNAAREAKVSFFPWVAIFDVLKEKGKAIGALGVHSRTGEYVSISAKAVILANGGGGALYPRNDNPVRATGDGYALAYEAGCTLRDMEFVQFIPVGLAEPGKPPILVAVHLADAGKVLNSAGEDVLEKYEIRDKPVAVRCRDTFSQAIAREEREGRAVYLDLRSLTEETWPKDNMARSQRGLLMRNFSCMEKPLRISPTCHFFIGGVETDLEGATAVPGLFAAGEVVGGAHGANRMGGNALSEMIVFGYRAGKAAGRWAKENPEAEKPGGLFRQRLAGHLARIRTGEKGTPPKSLRNEFRNLLWKDAGIIREREGLNLVREGIARMRGEELRSLRVRTPKEILETAEMENALRVGEMIAGSALLREESRGAHFREDFPEADNGRWLGNIFIKNRNGKMDFEFRALG